MKWDEINPEDTNVIMHLYRERFRGSTLGEPEWIELRTGAS